MQLNVMKNTAAKKLEQTVQFFHPLVNFYSTAIFLLKTGIALIISQNLYLSML